MSPRLTDASTFTSSPSGRTTITLGVTAGLSGMIQPKIWDPSSASMLKSMRSDCLAKRRCQGGMAGRGSTSRHGRKPPLAREFDDLNLFEIEGLVLPQLRCKSCRGERLAHRAGKFRDGTVSILHQNIRPCCRVVA